MPGVPLDAVSQVKKGFKSLFKKKFGHEEHHVSSDGTQPAPSEGGLGADSTQQGTYDSSQQAALPVRRPSGPPRDDNWKDIDQPPPPPPKKDYPPKAQTAALDGDATASDKPASENGTSTTPDANANTSTDTQDVNANTSTSTQADPPAEPAPATEQETSPDTTDPPLAPPIVEPNTDTKRASNATSDTQVEPPTAADEPASEPAPTTTGETTESRVTEPTMPPRGSMERDESPVPKMSATSGPLVDHPAFQ